MLSQIVKFVRLDQRLDKTVVTLVFYVTLALVFYTWCSRFYGGLKVMFGGNLFTGVGSIVEATLLFVFQVVIFRVIAEAFMRITDLADRYELKPKETSQVDDADPASDTLATGGPANNASTSSDPIDAD